VKRSDHAFIGLVAATAICVVVSLNVIFLRAPVEKTMGIVQKIFYFHLPCIYAMYLGAVICLVGSAGFLAKGTQRWDSVARAGGESAVVMGAMMLVTGSLWAKKAWGVYWTWDPRLTTALLSFLVYVSYVVLRAFAGSGEGERKFAAALGILGAANLPIIHFAVKKWGGTHPSVVYNKEGGLKHPDMWLALGLGLVTFSFLTAVLVWLRVRQDAARARVEEAEEEAIILGAVED
jgi:heme exporter protein C